MLSSGDELVLRLRHARLELLDVAQLYLLLLLKLLD
jgi:hypothetical protein